METGNSSESTTFRPVPADRDRHLAAVSHIISDTFAKGLFADEIGQKYFDNCHYDWATSRLVLEGERVIHHWGVWGYSMRLGSAQLQVAGIGAVTTAEPFRKRGLMTMAARDSLQAMGANGYDLSLLRGRHYARFGYVRAWNYVTYRLKPDEVPAYALQHPYQPLGPEHMDAIEALYNQTHQPFSGTAVRPTYRMQDADDMGAHGWFDAQGSLLGYVRAVPADENKTLQCLEATGDPQQGLAVLADLFKQEAYEALTFFTLPYEHPLLQVIRQGGCIVESQYFAVSGWRVRLVNLHSTLEKIRPMLEARLQRSHLAGWQGTLHLDGGEHQAALDIAGGAVEIVPALSGENGAHVIRGGPAIARLLIGSDDPAEVIRQEGMDCTGQAAELAEVLFPNLRPVLSHWDEY
jgi:predicted N-acetyltransferase YhbS